MLDNLNATLQSVTFRVTEPLSLPEYKGSTFRGALGHAFKRVACALPRKQCDSCLLRFRCAYSVCFETPIPENAAMMRKYPFAPHPFVLEPPLDEKCRYEPGEELAIRLCLAGRANDHLAHFIYAFDELAKQGLGRDRAKAELLSITAQDNGHTRLVYDHASEQLTGAAPTLRPADIDARARQLHNKPLRLAFLTPTRVKVANTYCKNPSLAELVPSLMRRLHSIEYFHCGGPGDYDVRPLLDAARGVEARKSDLRWVDWGRYSGRQQASMKLGGFTGTLEFDAVPGALLPYLVWGEILHVGKASSFGLGKYFIDVIACVP